MRAARLTVALFGAVLGMLLWTSAASAASIVVSPTSVAVGGTITLSGDVLAPGGGPGCQVPSSVTLFSGALAGHGQFAGPGIQTPVGADSKFKVQTTVLPVVAPGVYTITGRCGGGNLGVQATLTVTPSKLPPTGAGGGQQSAGAVVIAGVGALLGLACTALLGLRLPRRRRS